MVAQDEGGRAQDQGRRHRRVGRPSAATSSLLARYQATLRAVLSAALDELEPKLPDRGLLGDAGLEPARAKLGPLKDVSAQLEIAIKAARELATEIDPGGEPGATPPPAARRRAGRIDFG